MGPVLSVFSPAPSPPGPILKDLVLIGGGHSHAIVLRSWRMKPLEGVRVTLITKDVHTPYSGMLPGFVAGHYTYDECHIDLRPLCEFSGARLIHCPAVGIDPEAKEVRLGGGRPPIKYDVLSVDIGITPMQAVPGAKGLTVPVKPISEFASRWDAVLTHAQAIARPEPASHASRRYTIVVVGGGAGGAELIMAMHHRLTGILGGAGTGVPRLVLVTGGALIPTHNCKARRLLGEELLRKGIEVVEERAIEVEASAADASTNGWDGKEGEGKSTRGGILVLGSGRRLEFEECIWCTQGAAAKWLQGTGLALDGGGFIRVNDCLQSLSHPDVFAAGDIHSSASHPRPKAGVFAVRQGMPLMGNLRRALQRQPLLPFVPQTRFLSIISTGDKSAVATRANWAYRGRLLWHIKDYIDRSFMRRFSDLPQMEPGSAMAAPLAPSAPSPMAVAAGPEALSLLSSIPMRCGGCGSKVGATVLSQALARLRPLDSLSAASSAAVAPSNIQPAGFQLLVGLDSPDDAAVMRFPPGTVAVQTVDFFRSFISDPYDFGRIAANHALSDCYAMGADPACALAIAGIPISLEAKMEEDLFQMLAGAIAVLKEAGCRLAGGHTYETAGVAPEHALGFSITGVAPQSQLLRKGGLRPGDTLILTKPIGTGTLFAANMRHLAKGRWIDAAVSSMVQSSREAASILKAHSASAATDVTGFGLIGHLSEMLNESPGTAVLLDLHAVPLLEGAEECVGRGVFSSLFPSNARSRRAVTNYEEVREDTRVKLLFDPQTAGGLLAAVPQERALPCVLALRAAGYAGAAAIGQVVAREEQGVTVLLGQRGPLREPVVQQELRRRR